MTNLRNEIADVVNDFSVGGFVEDEHALADAILAAIKVSVPELVWVRNGNHWAGGHGYVIRKIGSQYTLTIRNQHGRQFDTLEAAQAAANAHHVAQLTDWMGLSDE